MTIDAPKRGDLPALKRLWKEAFADSDDFLSLFEKTAFSPDRCRCVTLNGEIAAALYWFDCGYGEGQIAYLYAVATAKAHRGKGLCRALMENTHRHLTALGYDGAILVPGSGELFDFYKKLGYQTCSFIKEFHCDAAEDSAPLQELAPDEYASLRRRFLPEGSVIQERENLAFLAAQATLYAGNGFVLAARKEGKELFGVELLGDLQKAPAILNTLGCQKGRFRTVGSTLPFAMFYPLGDSPLSPPSYFGLAFD